MQASRDSDDHDDHDDHDTWPRAQAQPVPPTDDETIATGDLLAGGQYRIEGMLGQGGMASVFRAKDLRSGREVALKVIARRYVGRLDREKRFENEGRLAARLTGHRNVAAPLSVGRLQDPGQEGRMYLAMELARGPTLLDLVSMHGTLPVADAIAHTRDVARALRDLHQSGVVHRDVKPSNVIVVETDEGPVAKLVDFGLAADVEESAEDGRLTRAGERPGTHHYMSPEQAWGAPAHPIFDVYALGATLFELLSGEPPWHELSPADVMRRKCDLNLPSPSIQAKRRDLPPALVALVDGCLQAKASERVPSAANFLSRLDDLRQASGIASTRPATHTGVVGVPRTVDPKTREPRLKKMVAEAAAAKAEGRPGPAEMTPIRTGATRPEIAADRIALQAQLDAPAAALPMAALRGATAVAPAAIERGHTQIAVAATSDDAPSHRGRAVLVGLAAGLALGLGGLAAWWMATSQTQPASEPSVASADDGDAAAAARNATATAVAPAVTPSGTDDAPGDAAADDDAEPADDDAAADDEPSATAAVADDAADDAEPSIDDTADDAADDAPTNDDDGGRRPPKPTSDGGTPAVTPAPTPEDPWTESRCAQERKDADKALASGRFAGALDHTRIRKCWPQESARVGIRVRAYFELSRYDDCIKAGAGSSDATVQRTVRRCAKARDAGK